MVSTNQPQFKNSTSRPLCVFLCHSSNDKVSILALYQPLRSDNIDVWFDEENLLPGQDWKLEIRKAVRASDVVIVCISQDWVKLNKQS